MNVKEHFKNLENKSKNFHIYSFKITGKNTTVNLKEKNSQKTANNTYKLHCNN